MLTGSSELRNITGLNVDSSGNVLVANNPIPSTAGTAIASGNLDVSSINAKGGEINVLGDRVGVVSANLNASGAIGGGTVLIGGDFQGKGTIPNAQYTFISPDSTIRADALSQGDGGKVIIWSDRSTTYLGSIFAKGGLVSGNGGFVEVSGKENLMFQGKVNTTALNGTAGTLLLDPNNITISSAASTVAFVPPILSTDFAGTDININDADLSNIAGNLILQATNNITLDSAFFNAIATSINFEAGNSIFINNIGSSNFNVNASPTLSLIAKNGDINVSGEFSVTNDNNFGGVTINLNAANGNVKFTNGFLRAGKTNNTTDNIINVTANRFSVTGTPISGSPSNAGGADTPFSVFAFGANAGAGSQGNISLQFGNTAPIVRGNGGNNLINIRLLKDTNFVIGRTPTTSGVDGQVGIGIDNAPPQVLTLLSDQSFSSSNNSLANTLTTNTLTTNASSGDTISATRATDTLTANALSGDAISATRAANLQANASQAKDCEPIDKKKPILTITASLPTSTRTAQNPIPSKLPPCKE